MATTRVLIIEDDADINNIVATHANDSENIFR